MKKLVSLLLATILLLSLLSAVAEEGGAAVDWNSIDWDAKNVSYQFTGTWEDLEHDFRYQFLINLYDDGTVVVDQFNALRGSGWRQFGIWSEEQDEDGNCISLEIQECTNVPDEEAAYIPHEYTYELYEEADGAYSFGYTFGVAPGRFFRTVDVTGSAEVCYESLAAFEETMNEVTE